MIVRLSYAVCDGNRTINPATEIIEETVPARFAETNIVKKTTGGKAIITHLGYSTKAIAYVPLVAATNKERFIIA